MCQIVGLPKRLIRLISSDVDSSCRVEHTYRWFKSHTYMASVSFKLKSKCSDVLFGLFLCPFFLFLFRFCSFSSLSTRILFAPPSASQSQICHSAWKPCVKCLLQNRTVASCPLIHLSFLWHTCSSLMWLNGGIKGPTQKHLRIGELRACALSLFTRFSMDLSMRFIFN